MRKEKRQGIVIENLKCLQRYQQNLTLSYHVIHKCCVLFFYCSQFFFSLFFSLSVCLSLSLSPASVAQLGQEVACSIPAGSTAFYHGD